MSTFIQLQNQFQSYLLNDSDDFSNEVIGTKKASKEVRLEIYKNSYKLRLQEALGESYSALRRYLGSNPFDKLCVEYIHQFPSSFRSIRWYGDQLPLFLKSHKKYIKMPHLSELALLEWKSALVFDAANAPVLQLADMATLTPDLWPNVKFKIHPTVQRIDLFSNTVPIWEALCDDKEPPALMNHSKPIAWVLWRESLISKFVSIPEDEACALDAILSNKTFSEMCEKLCEFVSEKDAGNRAASLLKGWITTGLIESIIL